MLLLYSELLCTFEEKRNNSIRCITFLQWADQDDNPLPDKLPGFTNRFAMIKEANTLKASSRVDNFEIKPGRKVQVVKLPNTILSNGELGVEKAHYYIHVNGESKTGLPDFNGAFKKTADFDTLGGQGAGELFQYRPKHFVPFKVQTYYPILKPELIITCLFIF